MTAAPALWTPQLWTPRSGPWWRLAKFQRGSDGKMKRGTDGKIKGHEAGSAEPCCCGFSPITCSQCAGSSGPGAYIVTFSSVTLSTTCVTNGGRSAKVTGGSLNTAFTVPFCGTVAGECHWIYQENPATSVTMTSYSDGACATPCADNWRFQVYVRVVVSVGVRYREVQAFMINQPNSGCNQVGSFFVLFDGTDGTNASCSATLSHSNIVFPGINGGGLACGTTGLFGGSLGSGGSADSEAA